MISIPPRKVGSIKKMVFLFRYNRVKINHLSLTSFSLCLSYSLTIIPCQSNLLPSYSHIDTTSHPSMFLSFFTPTSQFTFGLTFQRTNSVTYDLL